MSNNDHAACERHARAENFAAELATTVYPLFLKHGLGESWLKTELVLWKRLTRTIKGWIRERQRATPRELDVLRERLAGDSTTSLSPSAATTEKSRAPISGIPAGLTQSEDRHEGAVGTRPQPYAGVLLLVLGLSLGALGCAKTPAAAPPASPVSVTVSRPVERYVTDYADFTARIAAVDSVEARAHVWGYLQKVNFKEGDLVQKGHVLFELDPRPYQALLNQAKAKVAQDKAQLAFDAAEYQRNLQLYQRTAATRSQLDKAAAQRDIDLANIEADNAAVATNELNLEYTKITAPVNGRTSRYDVTVGNLILSGDQGGSGGTLLTTIMSVDPMYAYFDVDELTVERVRQLVRTGKLKSGGETAVPVSLGLAAEEGFPHQGTINFVDNQVNPKTGTLRARGVFSNKDGALSPGFFGRLRMPVGPPHRALLVSERALDSDQGQKIVYVVDKDNKVVTRSVRLGALHDGLREVADGLRLGERVIVNGLQQVRPGATVEPKLVPMPTPKAANPDDTTLAAGDGR
jgi:RND family efflux transporter MFP subunit